MDVEGVGGSKARKPSSGTRASGNGQSDLGRFFLNLYVSICALRVAMLYQRVCAAIHDKQASAS